MQCLEHENRALFYLVNDLVWRPRKYKKRKSVPDGPDPNTTSDSEDEDEALEEDVMQQFEEAIAEDAAAGLAADPLAADADIVSTMDI